MTGRPYTADELANAWREEVSERGFALVPHVDDPSFIVAVRPRKDA